MIAKVFVRQKVKGDLSFDYNIEQIEIDLLSIVEVPFGNRKALGVIESLNNQSNFKLKNVQRTLSKSSVFTSFQLQLAREISDYYLSNYSTALFSFLPNLNLSDLKKIGKKTILKKKSNSKKALIIGPINERLEYFSQILFNKKNADCQQVFILPTIDSLDSFLIKLRKYQPRKNIALWHSGLKSKQKASIWQKVLEEKDLIILGTRQALFLPFINLKSIFIDDPTNFAYQEDQAPYYNAFKAAKIVSKITGANLFIGDITPDINSFVDLMRGSMRISELNTDFEIKNLVSFEKETMLDSHIKELVDKIKRNEKILVLGYWSKTLRYICRDCQNTLKCEECGSDIFSISDDLCEKCRKNINTNICPKCKGNSLRKAGYSKDFIKSKIRQLVGNDKNFYYLTPHELEGTKEYFDHAILPYFEYMLNMPYLRNRQRLFRLIRGLKSYTVKSAYLYHENLENTKFVEHLSSNNWKDFLLDELRERRSLKLPPFRRAFLIKVKDKNTELANLHISNFSKKINTISEILFYKFNGATQAIALVSRENLKDFREIVRSSISRKIYISADPLDFS